MALNSETNRVQYSGNGATTDFAFAYAFQDATDLEVYLVDDDTGQPSLQTFVTHYDVSGTLNPLNPSEPDFSTGGTVEFVTAPPDDHTVVIVRSTPRTQDTEPGPSYAASTLETALDKLAMGTQYIEMLATRSIRLKDSFTPTTFDPQLPNVVVAGAVLQSNDTGTGLEWGPDADDLEAAETAAAASATAAAASATAASASASAAAASAATAASFLGAGSIAETTFTIANNQAVAADVTGLLFSGASVRSFELEAHFYRNTTGGGATENCARAKYIGTFKTVAGTWELTPFGVGGDVDSSSGQPAGVTLSITNAGQVQYTSTNFSGTGASSVMHYKANTMAV